jgi:hypothetical protein
VKVFVVRDGKLLRDVKNDRVVMAEDEVAAAIFGMSAGIESDPFYVWDWDANPYEVTMAQVNERLQPQPPGEVAVQSEPAP